ncbi:MAG: glutamine-hydrolyzing GMP synthase [Desulfomonile tiedjei]|uniref:GMP synthase [glutamine-hydrolyzing] n=1 Tax=Desulfomonile tiedjei TaxID=2358 RepID=A0A9D6V4E2_9BACT|nr:glutamine-hydrolyzing GMP synthase [Desulfomonile tiedjei]
MSASYVIILDFGSQYTQLIARRVREAGVYSEIHPYNKGMEIISRSRPSAIVLSGGPASVYDAGSPQLDREILDLGLPVLGICYGLQAIARTLGGTVQPAEDREYGRANLSSVASDSWLLQGISQGAQVWMSHGDKVISLPEGFRTTGSTEDTVFAAIESEDHRICGVQFHPEVVHTPDGTTILKNFLYRIAGLGPDWTMASFIETTSSEVRERVGDRHVVAALSGGVDSSVMVALLHRAIGAQLHPIFVNNGLLRKDEAREVLSTFRDQLGIQLDYVDASTRFLGKLRGVTDPERKRRIIGEEFIRVFEEESSNFPNAKYLAQGTLYPDVIESVSFKGGPSATIKSHHNVGGLPERMHLELIEPLRELFKDEVRELGAQLGVPASIIWRHPFPGPGLAVRILGEVTPERVAVLQEADAIAMEEIRKAGLYRSIWQAFVVLLPVRSVGVMGDERTYEHVAALRAVDATDGMTADWYPIPHDTLAVISNRIINEVRGINRVVYDISSKPPSTIEWE